MTQDAEKRIYEDAMLFSGAITASLSHEINNVLAIVNELSGLLDDFLIGAEHGKGPSSERRESIASKIATQMERGKRHIQQLNRFAHSMDVPEIEFDARDNCEYTIDLCERFARLRKIELLPKLENVAKTLSGCPFDFQHLLFRCIEIVLALANPDTSILVILKEKEEGVELRFSCDDLNNEETARDISDRLSFVEMLVARAEGSFISRHQQGEHLEMIVHVPYKFSFRARASGD